MGCNKAKEDRNINQKKAFSILYRIEWVVTQPLPALDLAFQTFSILYRIEWVVTAYR